MNEPSSTSGGLRVWKQQTIYAVAGRQAKPILEKKRKKKWMSDGLLLLYVSAVSHQHQIFQTTRDRRSGAPSPSIKCSTESGLEVWNPFLDFQIHLNINWSTVVKNWLSRFDVNGVMGSVCPCGLFALHNSLQVSYFSFSSLHLIKLAGKIPLFYILFTILKEQRIVSCKRNERIWIGVMPTPRSIRFPWRGSKRIYREKWIFGLLSRQGENWEAPDGTPPSSPSSSIAACLFLLVLFTMAALSWIFFFSSVKSVRFPPAAQQRPTLQWSTTCALRVYLYSCAILNKSNSHSNEDLVSVPQYARVRLSSPRLWGRVGLLEV